MTPEKLQAILLEKAEDRPKFIFRRLYKVRIVKPDPLEYIPESNHGIMQEVREGTA